MATQMLVFLGKEQRIKENSSALLLKPMVTSHPDCVQGGGWIPHFRETLIGLRKIERRDMNDQRHRTVSGMPFCWEKVQLRGDITGTIKTQVAYGVGREPSCALSSKLRTTEIK